MKQLCSGAVWISIVFLAVTAAAQERQGKARLSPGAKKYLRQVARHEKDCIYKPGTQRYVPASIRVNAAIDTAQLSRLGVVTGTKAGHIWTVRVPAAQVQDFVLLEGIDYIQIDEQAATPHPAD